MNFVQNTGTGLIEPATGSLTIYNPDGSANTGDDMLDVGDSVPITVITSRAGPDGSYVVTYDADYFKVTTDPTGNT